MEIIKSDKIEEIRKQADKLKRENKPVIVQGRDIEFNRKILEMKKVNILILQHKQGKDKLRQRDSGLNEVLCEIARKNNISLAIDFSELLESERRDERFRGDAKLTTERGHEQGKILGRLIQNLRLMKKAGNKIEILNKPEDKKSLQAFLLVLRADTKIASELSS